MNFNVPKKLPKIQMDLIIHLATISSSISGIRLKTHKNRNSNTVIEQIKQVTIMKREDLMLAMIKHK